MSTIDPITLAWIRNPSDETAAANGCRFSVRRGAVAVNWIERYCKLYEGEQAGESLILHGCHQCGDYGLRPATDFEEWGPDAESEAMVRAQRHCECVAAGHAIDWQYECTMRLFGWVRQSPRWQRYIRRFQQASVWIAKKNKKSPTLAAWGLYLFCGEGEPGQKVFFAAKEGNQARDISMKHAIEMVLNSEELKADCSLNRSIPQLTHEASRSIIRPLSSMGDANQKGKEGINGSVFVDETHVVDRRFIERINRAGISRAEPLHVEVSTAGNDPDGYGRQRFEEATKVLAGEFERENLFAAIYAAPQDLSDADLDADPLKWGRMANPAMGQTIDPEEYLKDYEASQRSVSDLANFKMYRLNIWQRSANPWLRPGDWEKCRRQFAEKDLLGRDCWAALDLSRTRDMSSLVLVFPDDEPETYQLLPWFWLPEERAREIDVKVPVLSWGRAGHIEITSGDVIDYGKIKERFHILNKMFNIRELAFDPKFAEELTQALEQETEVPRLAFIQNDQSFASPTADFERLILAGKLHHNGHPILTWQIGHANLFTRGKVKRVVRPSKSPEDVRTIDGIVAGIMGLGRAQEGNKKEETWYRGFGSLTNDDI